MSDGKGILGALALGHILGTDHGAAAKNSGTAQYIAEVEKQTAVANAQSDAAEIVIGVVKDRNDWRNYAHRLNANLIARKHSEHELLEALKKENINHPLATEAGFEARFRELLAEQYAAADMATSDDEIDNLPSIKKSLSEVGKGRNDVK